MNTCRHGHTVACTQCAWALRTMRDLENDFIVWPDRLEDLAAAANSLGAMPADESPWKAPPIFD